MISRRMRSMLCGSVLAAALVLSGCATVNAGSAGADAFRAEFASDPAIVSMDLGEHSTLP